MFTEACTLFALAFRLSEDVPVAICWIVAPVPGAASAAKGVVRTVASVTTSPLAVSVIGF